MVDLKGLGEKLPPAPPKRNIDTAFPSISPPDDDFKSSESYLTQNPSFEATLAYMPPRKRRAAPTKPQAAKPAVNPATKSAQASPQASSASQTTSDAQQTSITSTTLCPDCANPPSICIFTKRKTLWDIVRQKRSDYLVAVKEGTRRKNENLAWQLQTNDRTKKIEFLDVKEMEEGAGHGKCFEEYEMWKEFEDEVWEE